MDKKFIAKDGKEGEKKRCWLVTGENSEELDFLRLLVRDESKEVQFQK